MLRTKNLICHYSEVPNTWVFEHYLPLPERLHGQDVKIKSVFNPNDKTPSLFVYYSQTTTKYKFKDFSTGKQGDAITLVKELFNITRPYEAIQKIAVESFHLGSVENPVHHSTYFALIDRDGSIRGYFDSIDGETMERLTAYIQQLLAAS